MRKLLIVLLMCTPLYAIGISKFSLPVPEKYRDKISSGQGLRDTISYETWKGLASTDPYHYAIDFIVPELTEVYAAKSGVVTECYPSYLNGGSVWNGHPTLGGLIVIEHFDGTISMYGHLSKTEVCEGELVERGKRIGLSGGDPRKRGSGISSGCHLHFRAMLNITEFIEDKE